LRVGDPLEDPACAELAAVVARFAAHRGQSAFLQDPARYRAIVAGIGGGKSEVAAYEVLRHCIRYPGGEALVAAPSYRMIYRSGGPWPVIRRVAGYWGEGLIATESRGNGWLQLFNGSRIWFAYAAEPDSLRAAEAAWAWLDEASLCPREAWTILLGRLRQQGPWPHRAWLTTTPRGEDWVWETFVRGRAGWSEERKRRYGYHHWTSYDNPGLREDDLEALAEAYGGEDSPWFRQEILADFVSFAGLVYADWDEAERVVTQVPQRSTFRRVVAGVDWGVAAPGCIIVLGETPAGALWVLDECYETGVITHGSPTSDDWLGRYLELAREWGIEVAFADPADKNAITAWQRAGVNVQPANNARLPGIRECQSALTRTWVVGPRCPNWLAERRQYHWRTDPKGQPLTDADPVKTNDHAMDAWRYAVMGMRELGPRHISAARIRKGRGLIPRQYGG